MNLIDSPTPSYTHPSPAWQIRLMALGYHIPRCLHVAAQLDIATRLSNGGRTADDLAQEAGVYGPTLYRVLRALASAGVFKETTGGQFVNTSLSETLRSDVPDSMRSWVLMYGDEASWRSWGEFAYSVRTGAPAFERIYGMSLFDHLAQEPEQSRIFDEAMSAVTSLASDAIVRAYDFSDIQSLVDVGGGNGTMLCSILKANPAIRGIVFDLPHVHSSARDYIACVGLENRCQFAEGSFFEVVHPGADAYFLQRVLHDWDDAHCVRILQSCATAARKGSKILISEAIIPPGNEPFIGKLSDLHMLVMTHGGRERTLEEYQELFAQSGWDYRRVVATESPYSIVEGTKN
jgi:O-methyltransferase domain